MEAAWGIGAIGLIVGLVQVAKQAGLPNRLGGVLSVVLGALVGFAWGVSPAAAAEGLGLFDSILVGVGTGLIGSGAWSATKNAREQLTDDG